MSASLELARAVYRLLVHDNPDGLTRMALAQKLRCDDRSARDAVNSCRVLAATNPTSDGHVYVVGFDPQTLRYVAARDAHTARRVISYQESRVADINRALDAQRSAFERTFGQRYQNSEQNGLF